MIKDIRHSGIVVDNLSASLDFYRDLLGFKIVKQAEESSSFISNILGLVDVKLTTVKMSVSDGQLIELLYYHTHQKESEQKAINDIGLTHIAFTVNDVEAMYNQLKTKGIYFVSEPQISPNNYAKVAFCQAPEGTFIELVEVL